MLLKRLRLRGFKSFADKTDIEFAPGINVVVGPNGSGKSNVVDSLSWVMGTQVVRQLRGAKMEDVIFAGTPKRQPLGRAEVELVIDNSSGRIPVDLVELSFGRVLYRSGESRYSLNGQSSRLVDVVELLSDAGVGRTMHNIVGQGRIDAVLAASPQERRLVIEEAAGVLKHRQRRRRAARRLEEVESDLVRLEDLRRELGRRLRPLQRQLEGAVRYEELSAELDILSRWRAGEAVRRRRKELHAIRDEKQQKEDRKQKLERERDTAALRHRAAEQGCREGEEALEAGIALQGDMERIVTRYQGINDVCAERERGFTERLSRLDARARDGGKIDVSAARAKVEENLGDLAMAGERRREQREAIEGELAAIQASLAEVEAAWRAAGLDDDDRRAALVAQHEAVRASLDRLGHEHARLVDRLQATQRRRGEVRMEQEAFPSSGHDEDALFAGLQARKIALSGLLSRASRELARLEEQERQWGKKASSLQARAESLASAVSESKAAKAARTALRTQHGPLPRVRDLVQVDERMARAVASVLKDLMDALLVPDGVAASAIGTVRGVKGASLVMAEQVAPQAEEAEEAAKSGLLDAVNATEKSLALSGSSRVFCVLDFVSTLPGPQAEAVQSLLLRHGSGVFLVGEAEQALALSRARPSDEFVTFSGDRFRGGIMVLRSNEAGRKGDSAFGAVQAQTEADRAAVRAGLCANMVVRWREERNSLRTAVEEITCSLTEAKNLLQDHLRRRARLAREQEDLAKEASSIEEQVSLLERQRDREKNREVELAESVRLAAPIVTEEEQATLQHRRETLGSQGRELRNRLVAFEREDARDIERRRQYDDRLVELSVKDEEQKRQERADAAEQSRIEGLSRALAQVRGLVSRGCAESVRRRDSVRADVQEGRNFLQEVRTEAAQAREAFTQAENVCVVQNEALHTLALSEAQASARVEAAEDAPRRELRVTLEEALSASLPPDKQAGEVDDRIATMEKQLKRLGPVNPLAVEEYRELKERADTLDAELADVTHAKKELGKVMYQIDKSVEEMLVSAYAETSTHFAALFAVLFPGGEGRLTITEPENLLETGIEIEARPSGKSLKRLSLLSGGERTLSAIAFLFAVFRARPSPFYVLDEVEAALDDRNLQRFCNLLREFGQDAQVIIVTHQKPTMETAEVIYGVSLGEDGTSLVLSHRLKDIGVES